MTDENTASVAENTETTVPATVEAEKPEAKAEGETTETKADEKPKLSEEEQAKAASEAAKTLNERKQSARERVQQAVSRQRESERREAALRREVEELRAKLSPPDPNKFDDNADYTVAKIEHSQTVREIAKSEKQIQEVEQEKTAAIAEAWKSRSAEYSAEVPDFDDIVYGKLNDRISSSTATMLAKMEAGPAVAYNLGKNLEEAARIERLPDLERAIELGLLAGKLTTPAPRKVTTAPTPIDAISGNKPSNSLSYEKMSNEDYAKLVAQEQAKR
jgi:hypothetical protein